jgi:glucose repression regulatory protein TUP1
VEALTWFASGTRFASAGGDGRIRLWSAAGEPLQELDSRSPRIKCLATSREGEWLASGGSDGVFRIWKLANDQLTEVLAQPAHRNTIYGVAFDPAAHRLATGGFDRAIQVWELPR